MFFDTKEVIIGLIDQPTESAFENGKSECVEL